MMLLEETDLDNQQLNNKKIFQKLQESYSDKDNTLQNANDIEQHIDTNHKLNAVYDDRNTFEMTTEDMYYNEVAVQSNHDSIAIRRGKYGDILHTPNFSMNDTTRQQHYGINNYYDANNTFNSNLETIYSNSFNNDSSSSAQWYNDTIKRNPEEINYTEIYPVKEWNENYNETL